MNDFAKKELLKYGWKEGKGLGKKEDGIIEPIKTRLKFNTHGIGHDSSKELTSAWWSHAFNKAADSIHVVNDEVGVHVTKIKQKRKRKFRKSSGYGSFIKAETLTQDGLVSLSALPNREEKKEDMVEPKLDSKDYEQLFVSCGGRTAHKGARFGLKMNGKLKRLLKQEEQFTKRS